jgi:hypothetical protein
MILENRWKFTDKEKPIYSEEACTVVSLSTRAATQTDLVAGANIQSLSSSAAVKNA